jgi:hypothetical protein
MMTADDLLTLVAACLPDRAAHSGRSLLDRRLAQLMLTLQSDFPGDSFISGYGLGLFLYRNGLAGLSGATSGEVSHSLTSPRQGAALVFQSQGLNPSTFSPGGDVERSLRRHSRTGPL